MKPNPNKHLLVALWLLLVAAPPAGAQQSERYDAYELYYSVVNTTFISPETAARYSIVRGDDEAILNLALREHLSDGSSRPVAMTLEGTSRDLMQRGGKLAFREIREGQAIYYIAPLQFIDREWRHFDVTFTPEGSDQHYTFKYKHQLYSD